MNTNEINHTLPNGYILNDIYVIDSVSGEGGFGITYAGHIKDSTPIKQIAVKEYFPSGVASRDHSLSPYAVAHFGGEFSISFQKGLQRFLNEAVLLKKFSYLNSIVTIIDVFEANHTAYLIMEYIDGINLKQLVNSEGTLSFSEIYDLMLPVMKDLAIIHEQGLIHRDISPDNLLVVVDNHLHLIYFGSVSIVNPNESKTVTVILKAGYAPPEQYIPNGHIGPWTDVYGLCATMYFALIGKAPADSLIRMQNTDTDFFSMPENPVIEQYQWNALIRGLSLSYTDRFASVKMLYQTLSTPSMTEEPVTVMMHSKNSIINDSEKNISHNQITANKDLTISKKLGPKMIISILIIALIIGISGNYIINGMTANIQIDTVNIPQNTKTKLKMIDLSGLTLENAARKLSDLDSEIELKTEYKYDTTNEIGIVIEQSIAANTQFTKGELPSLTLTISKGSEPVNNTTEGLISDNTESEKDETSTTPTTEQADSSKTESTKKSSKKKSGNTGKSTESEFTTIHLD